MKPRDILARLKYMFNFKTGRLLDGEGNEHYFFHWKEHRDDGLPSYVGKNGTKKYHKFGDLHREGDKPAIEWADGGEEYFKKGLRHRDGGPALIRPDGEKAWYQNDKLHRPDGPARVAPGVKDEYWLEGKVWEQGRPVAAKIKEEKRVKEEFVVAAKEAEKSDAGIQALKDAKTKKPPPSLKPN